MAVHGVYAVVPAETVNWLPAAFEAQTADGQTLTLSPVDGTAALTQAGLYAPDWVPVGLGLRTDGNTAGPVAFVRRSWTAADNAALTATPAGVENVRWNPDPASLTAVAANDADRVRTVAGAAPAVLFFPRLYVGGEVCSNGYAGLAGSISQMPRSWGQAYQPVENARALCTAAGAPAGCQSLMKEFCGDPANPNYGGAECGAWGRGAGGEALDEAARVWCRAGERTDDEKNRCRCVLSEDTGQECTACQGVSEAGRRTGLLATKKGLTARDGIACALEQTLQQQAKQSADAEASVAAARKLQARKQQDMVEGYESTQTLPLWAWLLLAAALITCVAVFLRQTREHVVVRVAANAVPPKIVAPI
jgi:hypothetical protein